MQAEAYVALTARYETPLFSYAARMLGGLRDGERCLVAALTAGWGDLAGRRGPADAGVAHGSFARAASTSSPVAAQGERRGRPRPWGTASPSPPTAPSPRCAPPTATCCCCATSTASRSAAGAVTDMSEADLQHQLYRARTEFAAAFAALPADRCPAARDDCPDCAERERLRATPQRALLHLAPLPVRDQVRTDLRRTL